MLRWFARNDIASNLLMLAILVGGLAVVYFEKIPLEVQPSYQRNEVRISVNYRGGSPEDVERAVVIPIERAMEGIGGVARIQSEAYLGSGRITVEAKPTTDIKELLEEVRSRVNAITTLPPETEPPRLQIPDSARWWEVIKVVVSGNLDENDLLRAARQVRDDLMELPGISQANVQGATPAEISIEADPRKLRDHSLSFQNLSDAIRRSSLDLPAGTITTDEGSLMVRSRGQAYTRDDFANILVTNADGAELRLGDVAQVRDGLEERQRRVRLNGKPALIVEVMRLQGENPLEIADRTHAYVESAAGRFPEGIALSVVGDRSVELRGRLGTLSKSLLEGCLLVLLVLGLFLRPMLAFWIMLGIPVAFAGGLLGMAYLDITANVMSLFGFIIAVGLVVHYAIVTGENIYIKRREGASPLEATVEGAREVAVPVTFGVLTTIVAFGPLMFMPEAWNVYTRQIPPVVAGVLLFALLESKFILPSHLKHLSTRESNHIVTRSQHAVARGLELFIEKIYHPVLGLSARHRYATLAVFIAFGLLMVGIIQGGRLGFITMPSLDRNTITARVEMPANTSIDQTDAVVKRLTAAAEQLRSEFIDPGSGKPLVGDIMTSTGGWPRGNDVREREGYVMLEILDPGMRSEPGPRNSVIAKRWQQLIGKIPEARSFWISSESSGAFGGGGGEGGETLEIQLRKRSQDSQLDEPLLDQVNELLKSYPGIASAWNDAGLNRDELQIKVSPAGEALGLTQRELARQVRAAFFGEEAQRIQRDRDDIRVMVRLPRAYRQSLQTLEELIIRTPSGGEAPFRTVATATFAKSRADIRREDGAQIITVRAKPENDEVDVVAIAKDLAPRLDALLRQYPDLSWRYEGYIAENKETQKLLAIGAVALLLTLYSLLAIPFRSLIQPLLVLTAIPFGIIGALLGHMLMGVTPSYLSIFGMLALAGVVVNDTLVLVDFINRQRAAGEPLFAAVVASGTRRFRPIMLNSLTTFAGLVPLILDRSLQAQFLIPMAISLAFGILFACAITLFFVPAGYLVMEDTRTALHRLWRWYHAPFTKNHPHTTQPLQPTRAQPAAAGRQDC